MPTAFADQVLGIAHDLDEEVISSEIQKYEGVNGSIRIRGMDDLSRMSKMLNASGSFSDAREAAQCRVKVLAGLELGVGAFSAMSGIHIIQGKPSIGANLMAAAVKRHPSYNYRILEHTEDCCKIAFYERWDGKLEQAGVSREELCLKLIRCVPPTDRFMLNFLDSYECRQEQVKLPLVLPQTTEFVTVKDDAS